MVLQKKTGPLSFQFGLCVLALPYRNCVVITFKRIRLTTFSKITFCLLCWVVSCTSTIHLLYGQASQAKKPVTLEQIWASRELVAEGFQGFQWHNGGKEFLEQSGDGIARLDTKTGNAVGQLIAASDMVYEGKSLADGQVTVTESGTHILLETDRVGIYRRSSKTKAYAMKLSDKRMIPLDTNYVQNATLSETGTHAAWMQGNDVYLKELASGKVTRLTTDGKVNEVINGACDWVYEEEFEFAQAIYFSPDGKYVAFYRFDERAVPEYNMQVWGRSLYPTDYRYKYPKAGERNATVSIVIADVATGATRIAQTTPTAETTDYYLPRVSWTKTPGLLSIQRLNRLQNYFELLHCTAATGKVDVVYSERDAAYVEITNNLRYLANGKGFILSSEKEGERALYLHTMQGKLERRLTPKGVEIEALLALDPAKGRVFFSAHTKAPRMLEVCAVSTGGGKIQVLSTEDGWNEGDFAPTGSYFVLSNSREGVPETIRLMEVTPAGAKQVKILEDNATLKNRLAGMEMPVLQFEQLKTDSALLEICLMKPTNQVAGKKYPLIIHCYGGPGNQLVNDQWSGPNYFWFAHLVSQGYIVALVDNRGTGGRGAAYKKGTYGQLGRQESTDQAGAARVLGSRPYVDASRIALWGWSFGGYLTALTLCRYPALYKCGISVAPVTNWRFYDSIYTERYLGLPADNARGYDDNSPARLAAGIRSKFLLVHGTGDDNVHFQNSVYMVNGLVSGNVPFETAYYPDRHHGISGGKTRLHLYTKMTQFFKENL
jgi:dipeptidyl-peptidase 4